MNAKTNLILDIFAKYRMPTGPNDLYEQIGKEKLTGRIDGFVVANQPVKFSMLGYPFKSMNTRDKVIGKLPDLGEKVSLDNFGRFAREVESVYRPGCLFSFISDGYVFSDIYGTDDREVRTYNEIVRDMSADLPIHWYDMCDFYHRGMGATAIREKIISDFGITSEELERRILFEPDVNYLYRGMIRFMNDDLAIKTYPSRSQLQKAAKMLAREMMFRNEAYSALIRHNFADHIRLSMHQSVNDGNKYSFQLIPSPRAPHSPWHSALVLHTSGPMETMHKKDAIEAGYELVTVNGVPSHFQEL